MKEFLGNYIGIVIQNNDPEQTGKVKVFIPHLSSTVYKKWVEEKTNKKFKFLGSNINSILTQSLSGSDSSSEEATNIIEALKIVLPWAHCAAPLVGENASGRFNNPNLYASISDSNFYSTFSQSTTGTDIGGKPGSFFESPSGRLVDAFTSASNNINRPNPLAYEYVPSTYSNRAKGSFSVPSVGSHVWVFFREGNPTQPVYFAAAFGTADWNGIFGQPGVDYPSTFENSVSGDAFNINSETYRNKYVVNQKGGSIEIVNTDLKEKVNITHYSGSFKEFNNAANIELATNNDQKLVMNDQYETVQGHKNEFTGKNHDENIKRDKYKKIGSLNAEYFQQWKEVFAPIQDLKQLFEVQRAFPANITDLNRNVVIKRSSLQQTQAGTYAKHPVIDGTKQYPSLNNDSSAIVINAVANSNIDGPARLRVADMPAVKKVFPTLVNYIAESRIRWGLGGIGMSTSSQGGAWYPDPRKALIKTLIEANMKQLTDIENQLGVGGSEIIQITKHKTETIGMQVNDFGSIRLDKIGKMLTNELLIDGNGTYVNYKESPLIEYVQVQDLPGGTSTLSVCNRYNVLVGAGGLHMKSLGPTNITGTITNIVGEQVNITSQNEINIDAPTINISADILKLKNKRGRQVYIEDSLGVNKNIIVGGALSVEGELFVQHITAPTEYQVTEMTKLFGKLLKGLQFSATISGVQAGTGTAQVTVTLTNDSNDNLVKCYDHTHAFKNIPLTLFDKNNGVRQAAKSLNNNQNRVVATRRVHGKK